MVNPVVKMRPHSSAACPHYPIAKKYPGGFQSFRTQSFCIKFQSIRTRFESVRTRTAGRFVPIPVCIKSKYLECMSKRATTALDKLIDSPPYNCHRRKMPIAFRSLLWETIFSQLPLISFKRKKTIGNFLVGSSLQLTTSPELSNSARIRCKTCSFIHNVEKISGSKLSIKTTDHFMCICANVIYSITCTYCKKIYIDKTGRRLGDWFWKHLCDVERNDKDASKPVGSHLNLLNYSKQHMAVCRLSLHLGSS